MTTQRTDFPVFEENGSRALGDAPVLLDGMEVVFDKRAGLAPVMLVPKTSKTEGVEDRRGGAAS